MSGSDGEEAKRARQAAEWLARLNSRSVSTEELGEFYDWRRDPLNAEAYARGEQVWHDARGLADDHDIAQAVREALERPRLAARAPLDRRQLLVGAATLLGALGAASLLANRDENYETAVGEQRSIRLDDGSLVRLNTATALSVRMTGEAREITLDHGQAFFEVTHDATRPFRVRVQGLEVVALGTRFDVWDAAQGMRVLLAEGSVSVESSKLGWRERLARPGEAVLIGGEGNPRRAAFDADAQTSWTSGRLTFVRTPLEQAIAEVNRYSARQLVLRAPALRDLEVDGVFEAGDSDAFIDALTALFPLRASRISNARVELVPA